MSPRSGARSFAAASLALALAGCGGGSSEASKPRGCGSGKAASIRPLDRGAHPRAVVRTTEGTFTIALDARDSPCTTASFVALARRGYFEGTDFHRIVPGFVIQGGDPTGTGSGGPGYTTRDPPPDDASYTRGVVAMAKAQAEPPGTAGSQFFVVTGADAGLPPEYALLGKVVRGLAVVERISRFGDPATEQPTRRVVIRRVTIQL
jgi:cyclophilin family peptidyl-prolyl cis-trans isomerase